MSYATQEQMLSRFGEKEVLQLTDRERIGVINTGVLNTALADANALVDAYLRGGGYTLPLTSSEPALISAACAIARWKLFDKARPEEVQVAYDDAIAFLKSVAEGKTRLTPVEDAPVTPYAAPTRTMIYTDEVMESGRY